MDGTAPVRRTFGSQGRQVESFWSSLEDLVSFWQSFGAKSPCGVIHGGPSSCLGQICEFGLDFVRYSPSGIEGFKEKCRTVVKLAH